MVTEEARLQTEVAALLKQAEVADARDDATYGPDRRGDELPAELARREQWLETVRAAKAVLEQEAQRNFTDPESRIMPASDAKGSVVQGVQLPSGRRCPGADHCRGRRHR